ncbi:hypothetical protein [Nonomuraea sp. B5E05]|uniref:hypothetical protein n=1 Tax=Nonomuraea sp. B5E05 TaxID=3153569 RepID=UPI003260F161
MKRALAVVIAGAAISLSGTAYANAAAASAPVAPAGQTYGPYSSEGVCNYWMNGVRAGGTATTNCWVEQCTGPGGSCSYPFAWYFATL